jgi:FAD/FMN-containing dehydrogenase
VTFARETADRLELRAGILGHVGDGNFHVGVTVDPELQSDVDGWHELSRLVVEDAVARGGTCTGEHGVGIGKMEYLPEEHGPALDVMKAIKHALDPDNLMNPGKMFTK